MKDTIILDQPLLVNGKEYTELTYDASEITADQFSEACSRSADLNKSKTLTVKLKENDYALHMYLGFAAVIAVNPEISIEDMERIKGIDIFQLTDVGMLFTLRKLGGHSKENNSDEQSETTAEFSEPVPENLGD